MRYLKQQRCWERCAEGQEAVLEAEPRSQYQESLSSFRSGESSQPHIVSLLFLSRRAFTLSKETMLLCFLVICYLFIQIIFTKTMPIPTLKTLHWSDHLFLDLEGEERRLWIKAPSPILLYESKADKNAEALTLQWKKIVFCCIYHTASVSSYVLL